MKNFVSWVLICVAALNLWLTGALWWRGKTTKPVVQSMRIALGNTHTGLVVNFDGHYTVLHDPDCESPLHEIDVRTKRAYTGIAPINSDGSRAWVTTTMSARQKNHSPNMK